MKTRREMVFLQRGGCSTSTGLLGGPSCCGYFGGCLACCPACIRPLGRSADLRYWKRCADKQICLGSSGEQKGKGHVYIFSSSSNSSYSVFSFLVTKTFLVWFTLICLFFWKCVSFLGHSYRNVFPSSVVEILYHICLLFYSLCFHIEVFNKLFFDFVYNIWHGAETET